MSNHALRPPGGPDLGVMLAVLILGAAILLFIVSI